MTRFETKSLTRVGSLQELLATGRAIKAEEANRYEKLAQQIGAMDNEPVATIFRRLAHSARENIATIEQQAREQLRSPLNPAVSRLTLPQIFDEAATDEIASSRIATPYRALSLAVRTAERTFVFWSYLAAQAETSEVRRMAEAAARQELDRAALLRRERRQAYHVEHPSARALPDAQDISDAALPAHERRMADMLRLWANEASEGASASLLQFAEEASSMAEMSIAAPATPSSISIAMAKVAGEPLALAELLAERYLDAAEHQQDEAAMARAQSLAALAIKRLAWLRFLKQPTSD